MQMWIFVHRKFRLDINNEGCARKDLMIFDEKSENVIKLQKR